jgi:SulP family sulfate permease
MQALLDILRQCSRAMAYDNIGNVGELERRLERTGNSITPDVPVASAALADKLPAMVDGSPEAVLHRLAESGQRTAQHAGEEARAWRDRQRHSFRDDLIAGLTVTLVAIPQSLAYAQLAGVPAYYGLYAAFLPTIVAAMIGSLPQLSTGPAALTALLTAASVAPLAAHGTDTFVADVVLLALIAGSFQILFGLVRLGVLLNFLSHPVLVGFINAAALIIGLSQLPTLLGIPTQQSEHFLADIWEVLTHLHATHWISLSFGLTAMALLVVFRKKMPRFPGVLATVVLLTAISAELNYAGMGGAVVGTVPQGLPPFGLPEAKWATIVTLLPAGFVLALISFMEATSSAKVISMKTRQPWDQNLELVAQGVAKIASALSHSIPVSASFSRSALNMTARTRMAAVIAALGVLLTMLFFAKLLYHVPKAALAAIIMVAVVGLIDLRAFRKAWQASRDDGIAAIATFIATLAFAPNIQIGIITGILISLGLLLYRMMRPRVALLGMREDGELHDAHAYGLRPLENRIGAIRFDGSLQFVTSSYFENALLDLQRDNPAMRFILVQCNGINDVDASGVEILRSIHDRLRSNGISLILSGLKWQSRLVFDRTGLTELIGKENIFFSDAAALSELKYRLSGDTGERRQAFEEHSTARKDALHPALRPAPADPAAA